MRVLASLLVLISQRYSPLLAQDRLNVKEPEEINQFFFLDSTGEIRPIEREVLEGPLIKGNGSEFRLVQGEPVTFVVRLSSEDADPTKSIQFVRLDVKGQDRVLAQAAPTILFETSSYGESAFKIKPKADLGPGEYMLRIGAKSDGYCFGVDPVKTDLK